MPSAFDIVSILAELRPMLATLVGVSIAIALIRGRPQPWQPDLGNLRRRSVVGIALFLGALALLGGIGKTFFWQHAPSQKLAIAAAVPSSEGDPQLSLTLKSDHDGPLLHGTLSSEGPVAAPVFVDLRLIPRNPLTNFCPSLDFNLLSGGTYTCDDSYSQKLSDLGSKGITVEPSQLQFVAVPNKDGKISMEFDVPAQATSYTSRSITINITGPPTNSLKGLRTFAPMTWKVIVLGDATIKDKPANATYNPTLDRHEVQGGRDSAVNGDITVNWTSEDAKVDREFKLLAAAIVVGALLAGVVEILTRKAVE